MCTVGHSRPSTSPEPMAISPPKNRAGTTRRGGGPDSLRQTASTCWIPLPPASGTNWTRDRAIAAPAARTQSTTNPVRPARGPRA
jgi:hypothetical protein